MSKCIPNYYVFVLSRSVSFCQCEWNLFRAVRSGFAFSVLYNIPVSPPVALVVGKCDLTYIISLNQTH